MLTKKEGRKNEKKWRTKKRKEKRVKEKTQKVAKKNENQNSSRKSHKKNVSTTTISKRIRNINMIKNSGMSCKDSFSFSLDWREMEGFLRSLYRVHLLKGTIRQDQRLHQRACANVPKLRRGWKIHATTLCVFTLNFDVVFCFSKRYCMAGWCSSVVIYCLRWLAFSKAPILYLSWEII